MADQLVYNESLAQQSASEPFIDKQWIDVYDLNNGNYSGSQISLSTASLTSSGRWLDFANAYLRIPLVMTIYNTSTATGFSTSPNSNFGMALKNGFTNLVHSVDVKLNGTSITNVASFQNVFYHFKSLCTMSPTDLAHSPSTNFYPDESQSWRYSATATGDGQGVTHNRPFGSGLMSQFSQLYNMTAGTITANTFPVADILTGAVSTELGTKTYPDLAGTIFTQGNTGMLKRLYQYAYDPTVSPYSSLLTLANTREVWKNYFIVGGTGSTQAGGNIWYIMAIIPLPKICNAFENLPLLRSTKFDFLINVNQGSVNITTERIATSAGVPAYTKLTQVSAQSSYSTIPFMVSSGDVGQPNQHITTSSTSSFTAGLGICNYTPTNATVSAFNTKISHPCSTTSLVVPTYMMSNSAETEYLSLNAKKTIYYRDVSSYILSNITQTSGQLLMTSAVRPLALVMVPFFTASGNGDIGVSPISSAFDSSPSTTSPLVSIYDYQVQVSGVNVYQSSIKYTFESFIHELEQYSTLNGNLVDALGSGLISQVDFENKYCYIVSDLSRRVVDSTPKSISISLKSKSSKAVDLYCFVEVLRSLTIEISTGNLLSID